MPVPSNGWPAFNAALNATCSALLIAGFIFIRRKNALAHRACMVRAFWVSVVFLISYLAYHARHGATRFPGTGAVRTAYLILLASHTLLAAAIPPLALRTLYLAARGRFQDHRRIARWTFPLWLYVSVTGVVVYWMLYQIRWN